MGIAAYNRGSKVIRDDIAKNDRHSDLQLIDYLNGLQKYEDAGKPFGPVEIQEGRGGFWVYCPISGYGYLYKTIHELMRRWRIRITALDEIKRIWYCEPI